MRREHATDLARQLQAIADPVPLRILSIVIAHSGGEACMCAIDEAVYEAVYDAFDDALDLAGPVMNRHLDVLRQAGLLESQTRGAWVYHRATLAGRELFSRLARVPVASP